MNLLIIAAFITSLLLTVLFAKGWIPWLKKHQFGQTILEDGPTWHMSKQGTPTMGGLAFIFGTTAATLIFSAGLMLKGDFSPVIALLPGLAFGAIGFFDDYVKVIKKTNKGLTAKQKLILQVAASAIFLVILQYTGHLDGSLHIPFAGLTVKLPWLLFVLLAALFITGTDNATNLTDGIDGLLAGMTLPIAVFFTLACKLRVENAASLSITAAALAGGLIGFLIFNYHPAKVFMGDTGSLFIGGMFASFGFMINRPLELILLGILFYWETLSVMMQVGYFKLTHGKRIFKMAPFHHHLEKCGWKELKIFWVFTLITAVMCAVTWFAI